MSEMTEERVREIVRDELQPNPIDLTVDDPGTRENTISQLDERCESTAGQPAEIGVVDIDEDGYYEVRLSAIFETLHPGDDLALQLYTEPASGHGELVHETRFVSEAAEEYTMTGTGIYQFDAGSSAKLVARNLDSIFALKPRLKVGESAGEPIYQYSELVVGDPEIFVPFQRPDGWEPDYGVLTYE